MTHRRYRSLVWYHVISRGNAGNAVFFESNDYRSFLARMASLSEQLQLEMHAYALMQSHVHLFMRTRQANALTEEVVIASPEFA